MNAEKVEYAVYGVKCEGINKNGDVVKFCINTAEKLKKGECVCTEIDGIKENVIINSYKYYELKDISYLYPDYTADIEFPHCIRRCRKGIDRYKIAGEKEQ